MFKKELKITVFPRSQPPHKKHNHVSNQNRSHSSRFYSTRIKFCSTKSKSLITWSVYKYFLLYLRKSSKDKFSNTSPKICDLFLLTGSSKSMNLSSSATRLCIWLSSISTSSLQSMKSASKSTNLWVLLVSGLPANTSKFTHQKCTTTSMLPTTLTLSKNLRTWKEESLRLWTSTWLTQLLWIFCRPSPTNGKNNEISTRKWYWPNSHSSTLTWVNSCWKCVRSTICLSNIATRPLLWLRFLSQIPCSTSNPK